MNVHLRYYLKCSVEAPVLVEEPNIVKKAIDVVELIVAVALKVYTVHMDSN